MPVFKFQIRYAFEFLCVVCHQYRIDKQGMRSNEKFHGADRRSLFLKLSTNLSIKRRCHARPIQQGDKIQKIFQGGFILFFLL